MIRMLLAVPLALVALPAVARDHAPGPIAVSDALAKGCRVHHVHTPAGKPVQAAPIVKCESVTLAKKAPATTTAAMAAR